MCWAWPGRFQLTSWQTVLGHGQTVVQAHLTDSQYRLLRDSSSRHCVHWPCVLTREAWGSPKGMSSWVPLSKPQSTSSSSNFVSHSSLTLSLVSLHKYSHPISQKESSLFGTEKDVFKCMIVKFIPDITGWGTWWSKEVWRAVSNSVFCCLTAYSFPASPIVSF